jgi:hypothetical protein
MGWCVLLAAVVWNGRSLAQRGGATMIEYQVSPARDNYAFGEDIDIRIDITNKGREPIAVPDPSIAANTQPTFWISGPGFAAEVAFTGSRRLSAAEVAAASPAQKLLTIAPGASWANIFALNRIVKLQVPGEYRLRSQLAFQQGTAISKERTFHLGPLEISSIHLGLGERLLESGEGEGAFIRRGGSGGSLFTFVFREMLPSIGEATIEKAISRCPVSADATDIGVPWRNTAFFDEMLRWVVWREGRGVKALSSVMRTPISLDLPAEPAYLVRPPLKTNGGPVEVLAVSKDRGSVQLASFSGQPGEAPQAKLAWTAKLPGGAMQTVAALGPQSSGSERHFALVCPREHGFEVFHAIWKEGGALGEFRSVRVETGRPLSGSAPAMFIAGNGSVHVSVVGVTGGDDRSGIVAEAIFPPGARRAEPMRAVAFERLPARLTKAAILYVGHQGTLGRRDVVLALENGQILKLDGAGQPVPTSSQGTTTTPILLAPGKSVTYAFFIDRIKGLYVDSI